MVFLKGSTKPVVGWKCTRCFELSRMKYLVGSVWVGWVWDEVLRVGQDEVPGRGR
jgi:hypothetical protein